jgi:hypothetical protein
MPSLTTRHFADFNVSFHSAKLDSLDVQLSDACDGKPSNAGPVTFTVFLGDSLIVIQAVKLKRLLQTELRYSQPAEVVYSHRPL